MSGTIETDFNGFKQLASDFFKGLKSADAVDKIEAGLHCLGVAYFGMKGSEIELHQARLVYEIASKKAMQAELALLL